MDKINEVKSKLDERASNPHLGTERQVALDALNVITEQESEIARLRADLAVEKNTAGMLRIDLSAANIAAEKLRKDLLTAKNAVDSAEMSAKCSRALKEKAESENIELLEKCRRLEFANEQLRLKLNAHRDEIVKLSAERDEKNKAVADLKKENETLLKVAADAKNETDMYRVSVNYWQTRYNDVCGTKEMLIKTNNELVQARDSLREKLQSTEERLNEMTAKASSVVIEPDEVDFVRFESCPVCQNRFRFIVKMPTVAEVVPPVVKFGERKFGACPKCGSAVDSEDNKTACGRCGKLLDWGEDNADK